MSTSSKFFTVVDKNDIRKGECDSLKEARELVESLKPEKHYIKLTTDWELSQLHMPLEKKYKGEK